MKRPGKTFFNYLFSYLIAMMIPIAILGAVSHSYFLDYFTQTLKENKVDTLINIRNALDLQLRQLQSYAVRISSSQIYTTSYQQKRFSQFYDICTGLSELRYSNEFLSNLQVVNNELSYVYTPETRYSFSNYANYGPAWSAYSEEAVTDLFSELTEPTWLPIQSIRNESRAMTYIFPLSQENGTVLTAVMFQIPEDTLMKIAGASLPSGNSQFLIADSHQTLLYASDGNFSELSASFWETLEDKEPATPVVMQMPQGEAIVYRFPSEVSDLQYICVIDYGEIVHPIYNLQSVYFLGLFLVLLLGTVSIFFFMKRNYSPLHSLSEVSKDFLPSEQKNLNELEMVELAMMTAIKNSCDIQDRNDQYMKESLLMDLLRGHFDNPEAFQEKCLSVGIYLNGPFFRIAVLTYQSADQTVDPSQKLELLLKKTFPEEKQWYLMEYPEDSSVILIFSGEKEVIFHLDETLLETCRDFSVFVPRFHIGLSSVYTALEDSAQAFRQASSAARYYYAKGEQLLSKYESLDSDSLNTSYPSSCIDALYNAILSGEPERIEFAIGLLLPYFQMASSAFFTVCLGYDIINTALRAMRSLDYPYFEFTKKYPELLFKTSFQSTEEIVNLIQSLCMEICTYVKHSATAPADHDPMNSEDMIFEVIRYIKQNYLDQSFSAKVLADHFHMSISNFSHYFKKRTGKVVSSYIAMLRYEHAKELLRSTELSVTEIAEQSGYCHVSTFIRQFKGQEEITPNVYRQQYHMMRGDLGSYPVSYPENKSEGL